MNHSQNLLYESMKPRSRRHPPVTQPQEELKLEDGKASTISNTLLGSLAWQDGFELIICATRKGRKNSLLDRHFITPRHTGFACVLRVEIPRDAPQDILWLCSREASFMSSARG